MSDEGQYLRSDGGAGVNKAGWHCGGPPQPTGGCEDVFVVLDNPQVIVPVGSSQTVSAFGNPSPAATPAYAWDVPCGGATYTPNGGSLTIVSNDFTGDDVPGDPPSR